MNKYLSSKEKLSYAFSSINSYVIVSFASTYLLYFYTDILMVPAIFVTILMTVARIWDAINDPLMGLVVERTRTPLGRMLPYLRYGALPMAISIVLIFSPIPGGMVWKMIYVSITYLLFGMLYTLADIPLWGLMSVATPDPNERAGLLSFSATVGSIGALMPMVILPILTSFFDEGPDGQKWAYFIFAVFIAMLCFFSMVNISYRSKERMAPSVQVNSFKYNIKTAFKNRPMMLTILGSMLSCTRYLMQLAGIFVATYVVSLGSLDPDTLLLVLYLVCGAGMVGGMFLTPMLYRKFGYQFTFILGSVVGLVSLVIAYIIGYENIYFVLAFMVVGGFSLGLFNVITYPMVGDSLDYLEWKTGERVEGFCFSLQSFMTKFNQAFAAIALSAALVLINYKQPIKGDDGKTIQFVQSASTKQGLFALVTLLPAIGFGLSAIPMFFYNFSGKNRERILAELKARREAQSADAPGDALPISDDRF